MSSTTDITARDFNVLVDEHLKFSFHINSIVALASTTANLIHKCFFFCKDVAAITRTIVVYVRLLLEYMPLYGPLSYT